ncbi:ComEC/Rec2 family competence protein [Spartinivicinus poritis]|uniref:Metallo-beta-lactamase domain-containing protein n=1 Tax=Spartinivicinus poritis TaxID=2994640 RepID=A0ABT5UA83_9GAMM|nr:hypothetical protein [Spartinivicinus sp. A2-2]MDE1462044.1 hypothetical protein [Spartinivicinus sp. A2-2]
MSTVSVAERIPKNMVGDSLPEWQKGYLDLHHISTGRGDAAFIVLPDGTTLLIDTGDISEARSRTLTARNAKLMPNASKTAGRWVIDYIQQFHPTPKATNIDYAVITHFHEDHMGEIDSTSTLSKLGAFPVSGITEVVETIPVGTFIDRAYPKYSLPEPMKTQLFRQKMLVSEDFDDQSYMKTMEAYWQFLAAHKKQYGMKVQKIAVGSKNQIKLQKAPNDYPGFEIRNIHGNGTAWTGWGQSTFSLIDKGKKPGENNLSIGIRIRYGMFDYYTGGDIAGNDDYGAADFSSEEAKVAPVIGPVDVATLNHHGNSDSQSSYYVRTIRPKVWIQQSWSSDHPGDEVLSRMISTTLYPGERFIFANNLLTATKNVIGSKVNRVYSATHGHIVVRVYDGGNHYQVIILDDSSTKREVLAVFGPFQSR